ncbi:MAG: transcriptional coactivator p15/PC4 family protein [Xanthobacteraceae bacterium]|nr:transcriptional coactivator p15/PC4 family protein [Xanthobacteraceae bacterium]
MTHFPIQLIEFDKNGGEVVRVEIQEYRGKHKVAIRAWYRDAQGELKPGRAGITLDIKHVRDLARGASRAKKRAIELHLIEDPKADAE